MDEIITFFDFKVDPAGILRFGAIEVLAQTLERCGEFSFMVRPCDNDEAPGWTQYSDRFSRGSIYRMLNGRIWIGHDIIRSDYPRLKKTFAKIKKVPPTPKFMIDTSHFLCSNSKVSLYLSSPLLIL